MRKMLVIAAREYSAAIKTRAFIIGLLLMPIMMGGSVLVQLLVKDVRDTSEKRFVVIDRTPGRQLVQPLKDEVARHNEKVLERGTNKQVAATFSLEEEEPREDKEQQRFEQSERVRKGELFGFLDIGPDVLLAASGADEDSFTIRYHSNRPTFGDFAKLAANTITAEALKVRARDLNTSADKLQAAARPIPLQTKGLLQRDAEGHIKDARAQDLLAPFFVPFVMVLLMFMVIMMSATPLMQGVVEEKMQRIAEVLLGSVSPFQLMMGKLVGMTGVSLTIVAVYLGGAYWAACQFGVSGYVSPGLVIAFLVFQTLAALMFGSLFIAVGAACSDMKETQTMLMPIMLLATTPLFVLTSVLQEPNGPVATGLSFFPFATPTLMTARMAVPPGVPWWQPVLGGAIVLLTTVGCVFAAGRIFRVGILMQGKGARLGEMMRWVLRG